MDPISHPAAAVNHNHRGAIRVITQGELWLYTSRASWALVHKTRRARPDRPQAGGGGAAAQGPGETL